MLWGKKPKTDQCQNIYLELRLIHSRNDPFRQVPCSTPRMGGNQMSIKNDSTTSLQGVTNQLWGWNFIRKELNLTNSENSPIVQNLENKYIKNPTHVHPLVKELYIKLPGYISSWRDKTFVPQLGKTDRQQRHFEHCWRVRTKIFIKTSSKQSSKKHEYFNGGKDASGAGNSETAEQRGNNSQISLQERVCQEPFSEGKEWWAVPTRSKFKII